MEADYQIKHIPAFLKDVRGGYSAETWITLANGKVIKILSMKRHDGAFVTTSRAGVIANGGFTFDPFRDWQGEIARINLNRITKDICNRHHFSAVREVAELIKKVTMFYEPEKVH